MLVSLFGYFFSMIMMLAAVVALLTSFSNISMMGNGRHHVRPPVIGRIVTVEVQRHSPATNEEAPAKDVSPVVATAKADTKRFKHYKSKVFARELNNHGYGNALGYAEESRYSRRDFFFR